MRSRGFMVLVVAIVAGLLAMLLAARWLGSQGPKVNRIAVATADVQPGAVLTADMVRMVDWPEKNMPKGAMLDQKKVVGRVIKASLIPGEPVLEGRLAPEGTRGGLSALVVPGKRAMTVKVNEVVGVSGFALPGTFVDVLVSTSSGHGDRRGEGAISKIVLERIMVLAVAQEVERDATKPKVVSAVTLEVTPAQAEALDLARAVGVLSLVLRNQSEELSAGTEGVTKAELLGLLQVPPVPVAPARTVPVAVRRPAAVATAVAPKAPEPEPTRQQPQDCVDVIRGMSKTTECF